MGGTNAHVVLEEAPAAPAPSESRPWQLLVLSARTRAALDNATARLREHLREQPGLAAADVAWTLQAGRRRFAHRRYLVCRDLDDAAAALAGGDAQRVVTGVEEARGRGVAFLFPGQGSQHADMGRELYEREAVFRHELDRCAEALQPHLGRDLRSLLYPSDAQRASADEQLRQTALTQPALFAIEYALSRLWMSWGVQPAAMLGHSIGEYVAACLAGVFRLEDALWLVAERGRLMQGLPAGSMLAVRLPLAELEGRLEEGVGVAALNEDAATVVSGPTPAIVRLEQRLTGQGVACQRLHTSHAFHSGMMDPILDEFRDRVRRVERVAPRIPYVSNLTGRWVTAAQAVDPGYWARHLREPVRFADGLRELLREPERVLLEVGPGRTLSGLAGRVAGRGSRRVAVCSMRHASEPQSDQAFALGALGRLWASGVDVDWNAFHGRGVRRRVPLPTYPFERQRYWVERWQGAVAAAPERANKQPDIANWFYVPSWQRSELPSLEGASKRGPWLLFGDQGGLAERLGRRLVERGEEVVQVLPAAAFAERAAGVYELDPAEPADYTKLLEVLQAQGRSPLAIVHLWGMDEEPRGVQERGFFSLLCLGRALGAGRQDVRREILVLSSGLQDVTGQEPLRPEQATILGPCKVIPQEYPGLVCRSVDLPAPGAPGWDEASVGAILDELVSGSEERVVAYRAGRRWVQRYERWPLAPLAGRPQRLRERGVYLVTGGLGGIGLEVAESLAREARARLVLVGRGALPARADWERLSANGAGDDELGRRLRRLLALEQLGAEVLALQADAADLEQMRVVVSQAEARFGALHGVVHAVGAEKVVVSIAETGPAEAETQFRPRLKAAAVLEQVLEGRALDFCLLISSLSAVLGAVGSVAYTAAHAFLDAFAARHNRAPGVRWQSVNWDRWNTWREAPSAPTAGEAGFFMTAAEAAEALRRTLSGRPLTQLVVSTGDLQGRIDRWIRLIRPEEAEGPGSARASLYARPELSEEYQAPRSAEEELLAGIWCEALGLEKVGINDDFFELGGDSVLGLRIVAKANEAGLRMTGRQIFEHHTIAALAAAVVGAQPAAPQARPGAQEAEAASAFPAARLNEKQLEAFLTQLGGGTQAK
jgi:acyl transferase domain-containing protein